MIRAFLAVVLVLLLALGWSLWRAEVHKGAAEKATVVAQQATAEAANLRSALETERKAAQKLADIAAQHEADKREIESRTDSLVAELRAGTVSLHRRWQACDATSRVSASVTGPGIVDGGADDRAESASRIVRAAAECDAHVRGLQAVVRADRE